MDDGVADDLLLDIDQKHVSALIGKMALLIGEWLAGIGPRI